MLWLTLAAVAADPVVPVPPLAERVSWAGPRGADRGAVGLQGAFAHAPALAWSVRLPGDPLNSASHTERGRPLVLGDAVLVGSAAGEGLYRMDRRDGAVLDVFPASASVESEPVVDGDRVWFADTSGTAWCYRLDGTLVWSSRGNAPVLTRPTLDGGRLYVTNVDDLVVALDAETGTQVWRYKARRDITRQAELALYAAPSAVVDGDTVLVGFSSGDLVALGAEGGEERWRMAVGEGRYPDLVATPTVSGGDLFVTAYFEPLVAVDRASQSVRWRADVGAAFPAVVEGGVLFHPGTDGVLRAYSVLTGAERWAWDSGSGAALTEPLVTEAGLLVAASAGALYLVDPESGALEWSWQEPMLLEGITATPVVDGHQVLFVTNAGRLYSMVSPLPAVSDRPSNRYPFRGRP